MARTKLMGPDAMKWLSSIGQKFEHDSLKIPDGMKAIVCRKLSGCAGVYMAEAVNILELTVITMGGDEIYLVKSNVEVIPADEHRVPLVVKTKKFSKPRRSAYRNLAFILP